LKAGDTYVHVGGYDDHLWVVISDEKQSDDVLVVNLTSYDPASVDPRKETACVLRKGDHVFITRPSSVNYFGARRIASAVLDQWHKERKIKTHPRMSPEPLQRIRDGAYDSEHLPEKYRKFLEGQQLIPRS